MDRERLLVLIYEFYSQYLTERRIRLIDEVLSRRTNYIHLVSEDVYQEHNASALIRTCDCFGVQGMSILQHYNEAKISPKMSKGAHKWIDLTIVEAQHSYGLRYLESLKKKGYKLVATIPTVNAHTAETLPLDHPIALLFGAEKFGLDAKIIEMADYHLSIPMVGFSESLNVSVSAGIILSTLSARLRSGNMNWQLREDEILAMRAKWAWRSCRSPKTLLQELIKKQPDLEQELISITQEYSRAYEWVAAEATN